MPIRVVYCIDALERGGGTETQLAGLVQRLDRSAVQPHLVTLRPGHDPIPVADCPTRALGVRRLLSPGALMVGRRLAAYLREQRIDVVQTFFQDATVLGGWAAGAARVPVRLASFRDLGFWRTPRQEFLMRRAYPRFTGFVANSEAVRDHFRHADGLAPDRITVIPNGLDPEAIPFHDHEGPTTDVGIVGNMNREVKRIDLFVEAAGLLAGDFPHVRWHVVGDGHLRPTLEARARELGLGERAVFAGRLSDVPAYLTGLQVGVLCSDTEGFSNAVLEYMLAGAAVVATDVGGNSEAIVDDVSGLLVPPGDARALAEAIGKYLADPLLRRRLARQARERAVAEYSWDRCVARHVDLYQHGLAAAGRPAAGA